MSPAVPVPSPVSFLEKTNAFFDRPLGKRGRLTVLVAALLLIPTFFFPLWNMTLFSNQFQDGFDLTSIRTPLPEATLPRGTICARSTRSTTTLACGRCSKATSASSRGCR